MTSLSRRAFLDLSAGGLVVVSSAFRLDASPQLSSNPFTLGVASGDPLSDRVVIWTRLALAPLEIGGGMAADRLSVRWEVALDDRFARVVQSGRVDASPEHGHAVHVDVGGLTPHTHYWYRFTLGSWESAVGRTRTAPADDRVTDTLTFAFASCQRWEQGLFTALGHLADEDVDVVFHLGDYIYEYGTPEQHVRPISGPEIVTLDDYRRRYAQYRTDPSLQAAHAAAAFVATWDDHEVDNDYANDHPEDAQPRESFLAATGGSVSRLLREHAAAPRADAARAVASPLPLVALRTAGGVPGARHAPVPDPISPAARRARRCARAPGPPAPPSSATSRNGGCSRASIDRAPVGTCWRSRCRSRRLTRRRARRSSCRWTSGPAIDADRRSLLGFLERRRPANPVVITGDVHSNWVCDLKPDTWSASSPIVGTEFIGTSICVRRRRPGDSAACRGVPARQPTRPFLQRAARLRALPFTPKQWQSDYRVVPFVTKPGAPIETKASFIVESGRPGAQRL